MILFIDDEKRRMESYVEELEYSDYKVEFKSDVDSALYFFKENKKNIDLVILDIMMPTGKIFNKNQTQQGLRTGVIFFQKLREQDPNLPIIIFTNVSSEEVLQDIENSDFTLFCDKDSFIPKEFKKEVEKILKNLNC